MGTVGPGSIHLLNGLYDAKKSHAPVLALCGQVPLAELGSDYFQEVDNDALFADVAVFRQTITSPRAAARTCSSARCSAALTAARRGGAHAARRRRRARPAQGHAASRASSPRRPTVVPRRRGAARGRRRIDEAEQGHAAGRASARASAREEVLALAEKLAAPMVLTLKAKEGLERDNPFQVGQTGLIGNPAARARASTTATCC